MKTTGGTHWRRLAQPAAADAPASARTRSRQEANIALTPLPQDHAAACTRQYSRTRPVGEPLDRARVGAGSRTSRREGSRDRLPARAALVLERDDAVEFAFREQFVADVIGDSACESRILVEQPVRVLLVGEDAGAGSAFAAPLTAAARRGGYVCATQVLAFAPTHAATPRTNTRPKPATSRLMLRRRGASLARQATSSRLGRIAAIASANQTTFRTATKPKTAVTASTARGNRGESRDEPRQRRRRSPRPGARRTRAGCRACSFPIRPRRAGSRSSRGRACSNREARARTARRGRRPTAARINAAAAAASSRPTAAGRSHCRDRPVERDESCAEQDRPVHVGPENEQRQRQKDAPRRCAVVPEQKQQRQCEQDVGERLRAKLGVRAARHERDQNDDRHARSEPPRTRAPTADTANAAVYPATPASSASAQPPAANRP